MKKFKIITSILCLLGVVLCDYSFGEVAYYRYFPNVPGAVYSGKPIYQPGNELGYFIWQDESGWHIRWSADGNSHHFKGTAAAGAITDYKAYGSGITQSGAISWDTTFANGEGGIDFQTTATQIFVFPQIDEDPLNPPIYVDYIYLGLKKSRHEASVVVLNLGNEKAFQSLEWDGKLESGGYADSGRYRVRLRGEGVDGLGLSTTEAYINITTPMELTNLAVSPRDWQGNSEFSPVGAPDRISVYYNLSKDAKVTAKIYREGETIPVAVLDQGIKLGRLNPANRHSFSWRGNYPDENSSQFFTSGNFYVVLEAEAADGSQKISQRLPEEVAIKPAAGSALAQLDLLGENVVLNGQPGRVVNGDAKVYYNLLGEGQYFPPKSYSFDLNVTGQQSVPAYPYVPCALLLHRGFKKVKVKGEVIVAVEYVGHTYRMPQGWEENSHVKTFKYSFEDYFSDGKNQLDKEVSAEYNLWDGFESWDTYMQGALTGRPLPYIKKIDIEVKIHPADDLSWQLDDPYQRSTDSPIFMIKIDKDFKGSVTKELPTNKGVFKIKTTFSNWGGETYPFGVRPRFAVDISLAEQVKYSRLTNRFVPWFGFVSAKHPASAPDSGFVGYANWLEKLGFPGRKYFETGAIDLKYNPSYAEKVAKGEFINGQTIDFASLTTEAAPRWYGNTTPDECYTYLDKESEYYEVIPITRPEGGTFAFGNVAGSWTNKDGIEVFDFSKNSAGAFPASLPVTATTTLAAPSNLFTTSWPPPPNYAATFYNTYGRGSTKAKSLAKNPQEYSGPTIDGTYFDLGDLQNSPPAPVHISQVLRYDRLADSYSQNLGPAGLLCSGEETLQGRQYAITNPSRQDINISLTNGTSGDVVVTASPNPVAWTTAADPALAIWGGKIKGAGEFDLEAAPSGLSPYRKVFDLYQPRLSSQTFGQPEQYTFWQTADGPSDNPNLKITDYQIELQDIRGEQNNDFELVEKVVDPDHLHNDRFNYKLKLKATGKRFVPISGQAGGPYELLYFDGGTWRTIVRSEQGKSGILGYWEVNRLCGSYTLLLKVFDPAGNYAVAQATVLAGEPVKQGVESETNLRVSSSYNRAQVKFHPESFARDELVSVAPVTEDVAEVKNRPTLPTIGPIVEIKPSPVSFEASRRPTLTFRYTEEDLKELYPGIDTRSTAEVRGLGLNIHQITADGGIEIVDRNQQSFDYIGDAGGRKIYLFTADLDHFSDYTLLEGNKSLRAPLVFADRLVTNKNNVTVYGSAEGGAIVKVRVE